MRVVHIGKWWFLGACELLRVLCPPVSPVLSCPGLRFEAHGYTPDPPLRELHIKRPRYPEAAR